jgi:hypothetical protein
MLSTLTCAGKDNEPEVTQSRGSKDNNSRVTGVLQMRDSSAAAAQYFLAEPYAGPLVCSATAAVIRQWDSSSSSESKAQVKASSSNSNSSDEQQAATMPMHVPKKRKPSGAAAAKRDSKSSHDSKACSSGADDKSICSDELVAESKGDERYTTQHAAVKHVDSRQRQSHDADDYK